MKHQITSRLIILAVSAALCIPHCGAFDLKGLFGGNANDDKKDNSLGNILSGIVGNLTADSDVEPSQLCGQWTYCSPAVDFASDNAVQKLGGAAAASTIEQKLEPYYEKAGLTNLNFTSDNEGNFTMQLRHGALSGTIEKGEPGYLVFNFQAFNKIKIGKISARATLATDKLNLTFDVSGLIKIMKTVSQIAGNSTFQALVKMLESYDGLYAGFKLARQK